MACPTHVHTHKHYKSDKCFQYIHLILSFVYDLCDKSLCDVPPSPLLLLLVVATVSADALAAIAHFYQICDNSHMFFFHMALVFALPDYTVWMMLMASIHHAHKSQIEIFALLLCISHFRIECTQFRRPFNNIQAMPCHTYILAVFFPSNGIYLYYS